MSWDWYFRWEWERVRETLTWLYLISEYYVLVGFLLLGIYILFGIYSVS